MGKRLLVSTCICTVSLCASIAAFGSNIVTNSFDEAYTNTQKAVSPKGEINALLLSCEMSEYSTKRSFATVLQLNTDNGSKHEYDVAITTGHGLLDNNGDLFANCFVSYPGSKKFSVTIAKLAPKYKPATPSDWAVIIFPTINHAKLIRYSVGNNITQESFEDFAELRPSVLFATARGLPRNGQHCKIEPRRFAGLRHPNFIGFLAHTCRAIPGQSGAPISVIRNQKPVIIGIHIGSSIVYGYPTLDTSLYYRGYMREIDGKLMAELSKILADLNVKLRRKGKP